MPKGKHLKGSLEYLCKSPLLRSREPHSNRLQYKWRPVEAWGAKFTSLKK